MDNGPYELDGQTVDVSNVDKVLFPDAGLTKGDLLTYAEQIADVALPYLEDRPLALERYPDGITEGGFYQKQAGDHFPDWVGTVPVETADRTIDHVVVDHTAALVYLANQGTIALHAWLSTTQALDRPDQLVLDLDPPGDDVDEVRWATRRTRDLCDELGLPSLVKTSGSAGYHVHVLLDRTADFDTVRAFARDAASLLAARHPKRLTVEQRKEQRSGRVFVDWLRNGYGQTAVAPYSVRALPGAPVATPIDWDEVGSADPRRYTIENVTRRLAQKDDPWRGAWGHGVGLDDARRRLDALREEVGDA